MQKLKRKSTDNDATSPKKKKVQFEESNNRDDKVKQKDEKVKKPFIKSKKDMKKGGKTFISKPGFKGKQDASKGSKKLANNQNPDEKPKWSEMKKEKKNLRLERRKAKATAEIFEISHKAKLLAAQIQRKVIKQDFKITACKELHSLIKGQYKAIALTHDLSRVIQVLLKHSTEDIKNEITEELMDIMVPMLQSKYAQHSVKRILKYGTNFIRHEVIKKFFGHIVSLATHAVSAPVLDFAYGEFATKKEKLHMQQEFYGDMYKNDSPEMKSAILQSCKANIQRILDKNLHDGELFHSVLYDYMKECSSEDRAELISTLSPLIVPLSNSLPGVNTTKTKSQFIHVRRDLLAFMYGPEMTPRTPIHVLADPKFSRTTGWKTMPYSIKLPGIESKAETAAILKVVKEHVLPLSKHKTGYRLLLAIFDSVDDTVLVKKAIVSTLAGNIQDVASDQRGNMTLHWLVKPKDSAIFHPGITSFLEEGFKSGTSKKDPELRVSELRDAILPALKSNIEEDPKFWIEKKTSKSVLQALASVICDPNWVISVSNKNTTVLAVEDAGTHMALKKLAALDKTSTDSLGEAVFDHISEETLQAWLSTNRGCFFVLQLIENNNEKISSELKKKIKPHINTLKQKSGEGAKLLMQTVQK